MKKLILLIPVLLTACASPPKMPDILYNRFAAARAFSSVCLNKNMMTPQEVAQENFNISVSLSTWSYSPQRLMDTQAGIENRINNEIKKHAHDKGEELEQDQADTLRSCNQLKAYVYQHTLEIQNSQRIQQEQAQQNAIATQQLNQTIQNMPKTTYCNNIAGHVMCNTF